MYLLTQETQNYRGIKGPDFAFSNNVNSNVVNSQVCNCKCRQQLRDQGEE